MKDFSRIQARLEKAVDRTRDILSWKERREVLMYLRNVEYGLALEVLCEMLVDAGSPIRKADFVELEALARDMSISEIVINPQLKVLVSDTDAQ